MDSRSVVLSLALLAPLCVAPISLGCAGGLPASMTPEEVMANGTHTFAADPAATFAATAGALRTLGYTLAVVNEEKGILKTDRKFIRAHAAGGYGTAQAIEITRQYYVRLESSDGANTVVMAEPKVFIGEQDVSGKKVWALEGPSGERELWRQLFAEIQSNL